MTLVVGAIVLALALRITPGDPLFYAATVAGGGSGDRRLLSGLHLGRAHARRRARCEAAGAVAHFGVVLLAVFLGVLLVARIPALRDPVTTLLDHAGSAPRRSSR